MIKVKLTTSFPAWPILRQTSGESGIWGNCHFFVNEEVDDFDFWVVYDGLLNTETIKCTHGNVVLITGEPPSVKKYNKKFLSQFGLVITCHRDIVHPNVRYTQQGLPWHIGKHYKNKKIIYFTNNYDELNAKKHFQKDKLISVISSDKGFTEGHRKRVEFVKKISEYYSDRIKIFGKGINDIEDKWDAIARYKYHIVLENTCHPDYWSEKLSDAFLCGAYPFYYGCPNIFDYFDEKSMSLIDINDFKKSISIIENAIKLQQYEKSISEISDARKLVLNKYNLFPMLCDFCNEKNVSKKKTMITLRPEHYFSTSKAKKICGSLISSISRKIF